MSDDIVTQLREHWEHETMLGNDLLAEALKVAAYEIERLRADRDRWQKIALFNIEVQGYDDPTDHVRRCYRADGTYHGGSE